MTTTELYTYYLLHPNICTDTRKIMEGCLFIALKGENFDANTFAEEALNQGAAYVVIDDSIFKKDDRFLLVEDSLEALQQLATHHRKQLKIPFIGLTGSNGKTTTKELINSVLSQKFKTLATQGNLNNHIGVPLTVLSIDNAVEIAVVEMGANHQKEIEMLCKICQPTHGLITNIGKAHLEGFGGFEGVKLGKGELYDYLQSHNGTVFINSDSVSLSAMAQSRKFNNTFSYGTDKALELYGELIDNNPFLKLKWTYNGNEHAITSKLTGTYNFENILAAIAIGISFDLEPEHINAGISAYAPQNNRSQIIKTKHNTVIGDYYNANPSSMALAIENMDKLTAEKKILILGDMFEIGETAAEEHLQIVKKATSYNFNQLLLIGSEFRKLHSQFPEAKFFETTDEAYTFLGNDRVSSSLILLKGSRSMKLEKLMDLL